MTPSSNMVHPTILSAITITLAISKFDNPSFKCYTAIISFLEQSTCFIKFRIRWGSVSGLFLCPHRKLKGSPEKVGEIWRCHSVRNIAEDESILRGLAWLSAIKKHRDKSHITTGGSTEVQEMQPGFCVFMHKWVKGLCLFR